MTSRLQTRRGRSAFTLLELMLAITVLALVMTAIFSTWNAALSGWKRTAGVSDNFQRERVVMANLADLTKSLVYAPSKDDLYDVTFNRDPQNGDSVSFVTASDALLPPSEIMSMGMRRVTIGMQHDQRGRIFLGIANAP